MNVKVRFTFHNGDFRIKTQLTSAWDSTANMTTRGDNKLTSLLDSEYSRSVPFIQLGGMRKLSTRKSGACIVYLDLRVGVSLVGHVGEFGACHVVTCSLTSGYKGQECHALYHI